jgi:hypothetical protein
MDVEMKEYLAPTEMIDSDNEAIVEYALEAIKEAGNDPISKAIKLYYAVRDPIWYPSPDNCLRKESND